MSYETCSYPIKTIKHFGEMIFLPFFCLSLHYTSILSVIFHNGEILIKNCSYKKKFILLLFFFCVKINCFLMTDCIFWGNIGRFKCQLKSLQWSFVPLITAKSWIVMKKLLIVDFFIIIFISTETVYKQSGLYWTADSNNKF